MLRAATALGLLAVALCAPPAFAQRKAPEGPPAKMRQLRGVNLSPNRAFLPPPNGQSAADDAREIGSSCRLGARVVREFVPWNVLEKDGPGQVDPAFVADLDSLMSQAAQCRIKVIFTLLGTPRWDSPAPPNELRYGAYPGTGGPAQFGWMVSWILRRWPALYALEVWNEPNLDNYWRGTPGQYAELVNAAVAAKREIHARTLILAGTLAFGKADYLRQLYAAGMRGQDGISIHPYSVECSQDCGPLIDPGLRRSPFRVAIVSVHKAMRQNHDTSGLWLTEFGFSTCPSQPACVSDATQAAWMTKSVRIAACYPFVRGLTAFTLRDVAVPATWDATSWHFHFGLMGTNFAPKPSYGAVSRTFSRLGGPHARRCGRH